MKSSTLAIGAATTFALVSGGLSLVPERTDAGTMQAWVLRGTITPADAAPNAPAVVARMRRPSPTS